MTDQPAERPIDLRAELTNMLSVVDSNVTISREQMEAIGDHLNELWEKAHAVNDEQSLVAISNLWDRAQLLAEQNASLAFQVSGMGSIAVSALEGERATREALDTREAELGDLTDAIESVDESHPMLKDFAGSIRTELEEEFAEQTVPEILAAAYEEQTWDQANTLVELTGCTQAAAEMFIAVLNYEEYASDQQLALLNELMVTFEASVNEQRARTEQLIAEARAAKVAQNGH
jgi:hypothetical protein